MDGPQLAFAKQLSGTLQKCGVKRRFFDESRNLTEFLIDLDESGASDEREIAAIAVEQLCEGPRDDFLNKCVFVAVVSYLDDRLGTPEADASGIQRLEDLVQSFPYGRQQYLNWARGWYP